MPPDKWDFLQRKYINLMYKIARFIGLDMIALSFEDSVQELQMTMVETVETFKKNKLLIAIKEGKINKNAVDDYSFVENWVFDKYLKTALWNKKNKLGSNNSAKKDIRRYISIDGETDNFLEAREGINFSPDILMKENLPQIEFNLASFIMSDAKSLRKDGSLNRKYIQKQLRITPVELDVSLSKLQYHYKTHKDKK